MGIRKYLKKYKDYETKELARRAAKKKKILSYKSLATSTKKYDFKKVKFNKTAYTKSINNPYGTKFPKARKLLKNIKKKKTKRRVKKIIYYK